MDVDRLLKELDCQPGVGRVWVESKDRTHLDVDLGSVNGHLDHLIIFNFIARLLDLTLIPVAGISTAGIIHVYIYVTTACLNSAGLTLMTVTVKLVSIY